jgi:hypothetical protein
MASRSLLAACIVVASLGATGLAAAEPSAADKETARGLMAEGRTDRDKGDLKGALKAFAAADSIMHVPTTGLEVAKTQAALGQLVEARDTALRVMRMPEAGSEPGPFKAARESASSLTQELEGRIPSLVITVKNVPDGATATVTIDDAPIPSAALGEARKLNPGHHVVVAKAGAVEGRQEVDLAEKDKKEVAVELAAAAATAAAGAGQGSGDAAATEGGADTGAGGKSGFSKALMIGGFSVAGVGLVAGTITGVMSMSKTSSIKSSAGCAGSVCGPAEYDDISSARSMATISTVSFVVAGVGAVAGIVGLLTGNGGPAASTEPATPPAEKAPEETKESRRVHVQPWIGLGSAGFSGSF